MNTRLVPVLVVAAAIAATAFLVGAGAASAATITVNCPSGDLQNAIDNVAAPGDTIVINGTCYGNFVVDASGNAPTPLTLIGGSPGAALNGRGTGRTLYLEEGAVTIRNLTITNGNADEGGGLLLYDANLTMTNSTVRGNRAGTGAGMSIGYSDVDLTGVTITRNTAESEGGGIDAIGTADFPSAISITASTISQNRVTTDETTDGSGGGGIRFNGANVLLTDTRVTGNVSDLGGGIAVWATLPSDVLTSVPTGLTLVDSIVDHNIARYSGGGGIFSSSESSDVPVTLQGTAVSFNNALNGSDGGGILNLGTCERTATVLATGSTFQGNQAVGGKGGAAFNLSSNDYCLGAGPGTALMTIGQSPVANGPSIVNSNRADLGGGFANEQQYGGLASLVLQPGATVRGNKAGTTGGGVWNSCGSFSSLAQIFLNSPNNVVQICL